MRWILAYLVMVLVFSLLLICGGILIGSFLRVVFPSVDRGMSILIGLIACTASVHFLISIFEKAPVISMPEPRNEDDDDSGDEPEPIRTPIWLLPPTGEPPGKPRRKRR
jgi:hypothetical protein